MPKTFDDFGAPIPGAECPKAPDGVHEFDPDHSHLRKMWYGDGCPYFRVTCFHCKHCGMSASRCYEREIEASLLHYKGKGF